MQIPADSLRRKSSNGYACMAHGAMFCIAIGTSIAPMGRSYVDVDRLQSHGFEVIRGQVVMRPRIETGSR
jgi:hypothetical protein